MFSLVGGGSGYALTLLGVEYDDPGLDAPKGVCDGVCDGGYRDVY